MVNVQFAGQSTGFTFNSDRELLVTASPGAVPGLYPITVTSAVSGSANGSMAAANLAVQPRLHSPPPSARPFRWRDAVLGSNQYGHRICRGN